VGTVSLPVRAARLPVGATSLPVGAASLPAGAASLSAGAVSLPAGAASLPAGAAVGRAGISVLCGVSLRGTGRVGTFFSTEDGATAGVTEGRAGFGVLAINKEHRGYPLSSLARHTIARS